MFTFVTDKKMENRIQNIIEKYSLSSNAFAQEIDVNRSTVSHILSGRNKPSIEVLQKILKRFPEVSPNWLLLGQGSIFDTSSAPLESSKTTQANSSINKNIDKIVVFYSDNSFEEYKPNK
jgi:DNA-binding XRE family transcriptional regulator